ncbi:hypothetical protein Lal_00024247 [Lupinus albus]|uniref:Uncharacterized protein n=1 Tax=Lupinus albus TaxID=3870 RepID=A0A6A4N7K2_LUPAL|nr:hypothetical protein Lalb_Chr25g0283111 [Lupinus albus]KAF1866246.1 hypothetical protein Lal_00024247 [Lupinus albus]
MLDLFFTIAFSSVPLILYFPPMRSFNLFVETIEDTFKASTVYTNRVYHGLRGAWSRILIFVLRNRR